MKLAMTTTRACYMAALYLALSPALLADDRPPPEFCVSLSVQAPDDLQPGIESKLRKLLTGYEDVKLKETDWEYGVEILCERASKDTLVMSVLVVQRKTELVHLALTMMGPVKISTLRYGQKLLKDVVGVRAHLLHVNNEQELPTMLEWTVSHIDGSIFVPVRKAHDETESYLKENAASQD